MNLELFNVKDYMIHKPPMLLVDKVLEESAAEAKTSFKIKDDCIFLDENNILAKSVLIEVAAQSFAVADIYQRTRDGRVLAKGFLVSVRDFKFYGDAKLGDEIICDIKKTNELAGVHIIEAKVFAGTFSIAEGELRIFELPQEITAQS